MAEDTTSIEIGRRIRQQRKQRKMSQGELGKALGVTFQQVQKYEKGANNVTADKMPVLSAALGVDIAYFYEGIGGAPAPEGFAEPAAPFDAASADDALGLRLNRAFLAIADARTRELAVELVERMAQIAR